ncbi:Glycine betaine ABC transport system, glycine betaine-binding protein OpuAC [Myxococcus hansupus]|uniref:Glycine betaine ABC transport system, glycine betaine-binding protein OpuAC n=1 Tax=Pseudomyxococcus hansupus TaxID=1297742 RepID=A0A0H4X204_9BACT|nr:glycine betaine ABC transporter substrate-binding protein [Myxococcus hansupus]AKQ67888.1 Glycine betaine ABC transport system, glycine betaine-binding protein OpuAC [Myxococcus hansupus]
MNLSSLHRLPLVLSAVAGLLVAPGCKQENKAPAAEGAETAAPAKKPVVRIVYVNWAEGVAMTHLVQAVLEDKMGYQVKTTMADVAPVFASLANGDADFFLDSWLPVTHQSYMERFKGKVVDLGVSYDDARIGLVVPADLDINSIEQLNGKKQALNQSIVGIDSGAGIMTTTEKAIEAYGLELKLVPSSGPAMTAELKDAVAKKRPVVVTGWKPHWKFARWDLKFLEDPKGVYGAKESIHTLSRVGLEKDLPDVAALLRNFKLDDQQLGSLMGAVEDAAGTPEKAVREWMKQNQALVDGWIPKA